MHQPPERLSTEIEDRPDAVDAQVIVEDLVAGLRGQDIGDGKLARGRRSVDVDEIHAADYSGGPEANAAGLSALCYLLSAICCQPSANCDSLPCRCLKVRYTFSAVTGRSLTRPPEASATALAIAAAVGMFGVSPMLLTL